MGTLRVLLEKEITQIRRNPILPRIFVAMPIALMLVIPWITTMDVNDVKVAIVDNDCSSVSQRITSHVKGSTYFSFRGNATDYQSAQSALESGEIDVIILIPNGFERNLSSQQPKPIDLTANAVNATKGSLGMQYVMQTTIKAIGEIQQEKGLNPTSSDVIAIKYFYNETLNYQHYMIPALMIIVLLLICCFIPALNIVSEKESGTIEQINVTPVSRLSFTLAKLIPFWIIGIIVLSIAMLLAWLVYGLTPTGSLGAIYLGAALFVVTMSGFGVAVANISDTMQQAIFVMFFFVMIFMLMSGLLTPLTSMPQWAQDVTYLFPPRYFVKIMRAVYLKGATIAEIKMEYICLACAAVVFNTLATLTYKKQS
ncbi:MAG: ABC transporter permease [Bacteroidales bacterium]|nr:ABC transporter permease [Bacteroidales bacterium]